MHTISIKITMILFKTKKIGSQERQSWENTRNFAPEDGCGKLPVTISKKMDCIHHWIFRVLLSHTFLKKRDSV
jgi:hypothetical protein